MSESARISFVISRLHVQLKVDLLPSRLVYIQPYHCAEKNMRLWNGISQAQAMRAQLSLDADKKTSAHQILVAHFEQKGWAVRALDNNFFL